MKNEKYNIVFGGITITRKSNLYFFIFHYSFSSFIFSGAKLRHLLHIRNPHLYGFSFILSPFEGEICQKLSFLSIIIRNLRKKILIFEYCRTTKK